jgi:hypothetical protein
MPLDGASGCVGSGRLTRISGLFGIVAILKFGWDLNPRGGLRSYGSSRPSDYAVKHGNSDDSGPCVASESYMHPTVPNAMTDTLLPLIHE